MVIILLEVILNPIPTKLDLAIESLEQSAAVSEYELVAKSLNLLRQHRKDHDRLLSLVLSKWPAGGWILSSIRSGMHFYNGTELIGSPGKYYFEEYADALSAAFCEL